MSEIKSEVIKSADSVKPGYKTSEFYLMLLALLLGVFMQSDILGEGHWAMKAIIGAAGILGAMGFGSGRAKVKLGALLGEAAKKL